MKTLFVLLFAIFGLTATAKDYYISNSGNDANDGTSSSTPWKTIAKLNAVKLSAGDNVLFKRGDTFYGNIIAPNTGRSGNPIYYGAYGSGAKPVITGFTSITSWTNKGGNIWESTNAVSSLPDLKTVIIKGKSRPMGRFPNGDASYPFLPNFNTFQSSTGTGIGASSITSSSLSGGNNWTGAEVVVRVTQWSFHRNVIKSQIGNTLNFSGIGGGLKPGWGFFVQNDIRTLDRQDEWYYNPVTKKLSIYSTTRPTDVQVSTVETLFYLYSNIPAVNSTNIDNINFTGANTNAIKISGNLTFSVTNCDISYSGLEGMLLFGGGIQSGTINNNTFSNNGSSGIFTTGSVTNLTVTNNQVNMSGVVSVYKQDDYTNGGMGINAPGSLIQHNAVDSSAYCGITFSGSNIQVRNNFVNHSALVRADAAGIYTGFANQTGKVIDGNVILNSIGNKRGTVKNDLFTFGIYIDDLGTGVQITNNTIANCATGGIYIHNSNNITARHNTIYNCGAADATEFATMWGNGGLAIDGNEGVFSNTLYNNSVKNNIILATNQYQYALNYYSAERSGNDVNKFGIIDSNYYEKINFQSTLIKNRQRGFNGEMSIAQWKTFSGKDVNLQKSPKAITNLNDLRFEYNATNQSKTFALNANYIDVKGKAYQGSVTIQPYSSVILIKNGSLSIPNVAPIADAGSNISITLPDNKVSLDGKGKDTDGKIVSYSWEKIAGPSNFKIDKPSSANTTLSNLVEGSYSFRLTVKDDKEATGRDTVTIIVNPAPNVAPIADAGSNISITLPDNKVSLDGKGKDTDGKIVSYSWEKIAGPSNFKIDKPSSANATLSNLVEGSYSFRLTVKDDKEATGKDTVTITVNPALPNDKGSLEGKGKDNDGNLTSFDSTNLINNSGSTNLLPAVNPSNTVNGIDYKYFEGSNYTALPDFVKSSPVKTGNVSNFDLSVARRAEQYAVNFTGYINVPSDGQYTFYTTSDDGSNLHIDGVKVVDNDGLHSQKEISGTIGLKAGKHAISAGFFQGAGDKILRVSYAGPGVAKQTVPSSALYRVSSRSRMAAMDTDFPGINNTLNAEAVTKGPDDIQLKVGITAYPNPFISSIIVSITGESGTYNLLLVDVLGRTIWTRKGSKNSGTYQQSINTSSIKRGIYFLRVIQNNKTAVIKLQK